MKKNLITAALIAGATLFWLLSGVWGGRGSASMEPATAVLPPSPDAPMRVRVRQFQAEQHTITHTLRGKTESKRSARVSAEVSGRVVSRPVERGDRVQPGDVLCELAVDDREATLAEARADLYRAQIEFKGAQELRERGLLSEVRIAQVQAELAAARARVEQDALNLARTRITAPFGGVVETLHLEVGDFAAVGGPCATVLDLDPLLIAANVSEREVGYIEVGSEVSALTRNEQRLEGRVSFVGSQSDPATRTYPVEVTVPNPDYAIRAGLTTVVSVESEAVLAHRVSPALFTLDDEGIVGLRAVDSNERVVFHPVEVVEDAPEGAWVTGLPGVVRLIVVGQEFVSEGQRVEALDMASAPVAARGH